MISLLAAMALNAAVTTSMPPCNVVVATDAPNVNAVIQHEIAHCWGWKHSHAKHDANKKLNAKYRASFPPLWYRMKGMYPNMGDGIRFELSKDVLKLCDGGSAYGCQWGGLQDD